ncbi:MAG TPA: alpha/beta hydrolase, partial [Mycobacteriales bacterium]|nr:alpha/beta hydrolase [Mycobacteriales bacterium]
AGMSQIAISTAATARTVDTPAGPLALLDTGPDSGAGRPPVLLVPGYTGSKEDFLPLFDPLAEAGWRVAAMDQRGQYESPGTDDPAGYTVPALAADLLAVAADLGPTVHVVGHSFGGLVARAAVIGAPGSFGSLVLLDSGPDGLAGTRRERMEALRPVLAGGGMVAVYAAMEQLAAGDPRWRDGPQELRDFLKRRFLASSPVGLEAMGDALVAEPDRVDELRATAVPVLVCHGEADDAWSPATQARMAGRLGAAHVVIGGAVHSPAIENTTATVRALLDFWSRTSVPPAPRGEVFSRKPHV